jgi:hypothetical protein
MQYAISTRNTKGRKAVLLTAVAVLLLIQGNPSLAKRPSFLVPSNEKLGEGSGPQTNDSSKKTVDTADGDKQQSLAPVTLDAAPSAGAVTGQAASTAGGSGTVLKSTVTATDFVPKGPVDPSSKSLFIAPRGIADKLDDNLKNAKSVNVMPLPLLMSDDEAEKKIETVVDAEKAELAELWESTLTRSPDIQFVIQKLMPSSNPGHAASIIMRMLGTAVYGGMGAMQMMMPNAAGYMLSGTGGSAIMNVLNVQEGKIAKNARLSQTEAIMLYNMVRTTADKLVENFRNYKKCMSNMQKANTDLQDLQGMVSDARAGQDPTKQLEMEYTIRKQQREVDLIGEDLKRFRQGLVDLAGPEAIAKLDKEVDDEQNKIEQATPAGTPNPSPAGTPAQNQQTADTSHSG